jgi:hypothetical protein
VFIYRASSGTARTMTPRPEKDTTGKKRGLSAFERSELVPGAPGEKVTVQVIDTDKLAAPLSVVRHGDGHVSIVPMNVQKAGEIDDAGLIAWAATREAEEPDDLTKKVLAAVVKREIVLRKEGQ